MRILPWKKSLCMGLLLLCFLCFPSFRVCAENVKSNSYVNIFNSSMTEYVYPDQIYCFNLDCSDGYYAVIVAPKSMTFQQDGKICVTRKEKVSDFSGTVISTVPRKVYPLYPFNLATEFSYDGIDFVCRYLIIDGGGYIDGCPYYCSSLPVRDCVYGAFCHNYDMYKKLMDNEVKIDGASFDVDLTGVESSLDDIKQLNTTSNQTVEQIRDEVAFLDFDFTIDEDLKVNIQELRTFVTLIFFCVALTYFGNKIRSWRNYAIGRKKS